MPLPAYVCIGRMLRAARNMAGSRYRSVPQGLHACIIVYGASSNHPGLLVQQACCTQMLHTVGLLRSALLGLARLLPTANKSTYKDSHGIDAWGRALSG